MHSNSDMRLPTRLPAEGDLPALRAALRREELVALEGLRQFAPEHRVAAAAAFRQGDLDALELLAEGERQPLARVALFHYRRVLWASQLLQEKRETAARGLLSHAGIRPFLRAKGE